MPPPPTTTTDMQQGHVAQRRAHHGLPLPAGLGGALLLIELQVVVLAVRQRAGVEVLHVGAPQLPLVVLQRPGVILEQGPWEGEAETRQSSLCSGIEAGDRFLCICASKLTVL